MLQFLTCELSSEKKKKWNIKLKRKRFKENVCINKYFFHELGI